MSGHAVLSASSSHRWLNCPPSARLAEQFPDRGSTHAAAGTLAHAIAEWKARQYFIEHLSARTYSAGLKRLKEDTSYSRDMDAATDEYLDYLKELALSFGETPPFVALENRVDYSAWAPEGFGTADCIMIGGGRLCVCDYKNGSGVAVEAEENSQMMLYALGALKVYAPIYGDSIREIHLAVIQPHAGGVKTWGLTRAALEDWGEKTVRPAAALAWEGKGDFRPGPWCDKSFCPARAQCTARAKVLLEMEPMKDRPPALLDDGEVGDLLARARQLEAWIKDLEDYALKACLAGRPVSGFKVVEGRGGREWISGADAAFAQLLARGVEEAMLWERKPVTPPGLEKAMGKKAFSETAGDLVARKPGKPALVPESDKKPSYIPAEAAFTPVNTTND